MKAQGCPLGLPAHLLQEGHCVGIPTVSGCRTLTSQWLRRPASALGPSSQMVPTLLGESSGRPRTRPLEVIRGSQQGRQPGMAFHDVTASELRRLQPDQGTSLLQGTATLISIDIYKRGSCFRTEGACLLALKDTRSWAQGYQS